MRETAVNQYYFDLRGLWDQKLRTRIHQPVGRTEKQSIYNTEEKKGKMREKN